jgi:hypothetical protein
MTGRPAAHGCSTDPPTPPPERSYVQQVEPEEEDMLQAILVWSGAVIGLSLLLVMALGPVIVEVDSWWYERKHNRRLRKARKSAATKAAPVRELARV